MFTQLNRVDNVLYIEEDIDLNQIFYPFKLNSRGKNFSPDIIFNNDNPNSHIILTGEAGSGKTTLLKHVFIRELNKKENLPIFLWFSKFIQEITDFEGFLIDHISDISGANRVDVKILLSKGFFSLIMDGLDEYKHFGESITYSIEKFIFKYPKTKLLLSTRPSPLGLENTTFERYQIKPFESSDAIAFVEKQKIAKSIKNEAIKVLSKLVSKYAYLTDDLRVYALRNPLSMTMFLMALRDGKIDTQSSNIDFFKLTIEKLVKIGKSRDDANISSNKVLKIIEEIAWETFKNRNTVFTEIQIQEIIDSSVSTIKEEVNPERMTNQIILSSIIVKEGIYYKFFHRSIQDYLAISKLSRHKKEEKQKHYIDTVEIVSDSLNSLHSHEFLLLLKEVSRTDFEKFILFPVLEKTAINPAKHGDEFILKSFFSRYEYYFGYHFIEEEMKVEYNESLGRMMDFNEVVLKVAELDPNPNIFSEKVRDFHDYLEEISEEKFNSEFNMYPLVKEIGGENYLEIFNELKITQSIRNYYQKIYDYKDKIDKFKE